MKNLIPKFVISTLLAPVFFLLASSFNASAQEYDDLYFTAGDRKKAKFLQEQESPSISKMDDAVLTEEAEEVDAKTINPDYIVKYNRGVADKRKQNVDSVSEYYVEDYERDDKNVVINNYYGNARSNYYYDPYASRWGYNPYYDPFYDPFWSSRYYGPSWGWHSGWHITIGYGFGRPYYYNPWSWGNHNPYYYGRYYSAWDSPYYGYNNYYYGGNYYGGYHNYYYSNHTSVNRNRIYYNRETGDYQVRNVSRGSYSPRSSSTNVGDGTSARRSVTSSGTQSTNGRIANYRDHSNTQNDYYRRTRSDLSSGSSIDEGARKSYNPTTVNRDESTRTAIQSRNTSSENSRFSTPARSNDYYNTRSFDTRRTSTPANSNIRTNTEQSGSRTVSPRPTETPSRTYTPARQNSERNETTPSRTYTPSRSTSPSRETTPSRTYSPSRSSGSDSYSPSRSSGSGSGSYSPSRSNSSEGSSYTPSRSSYPSSGGNSSGSTPSRSSSGGSSDGGSRRSR